MLYIFHLFILELYTIIQRQVQVVQVVQVVGCVDNGLHLILKSNIFNT